MRLTQFFLFLLSALSPYLGAQSIIEPLTKVDSKIRLLDSERQPLAQFPFFWVRGTSIVSLKTDEFGECLIPGLESAILRVSADMGRIMGDSIWPRNREEFIIETQISQINPVSITASVNPRLATDNPYAIQVVSRKTIEKMAAQNVADVLQNQSGVLLGQDPNLGASVQLQGLGGQNVKILINGVPMIGRLNGNIDVSQIPSENIERIEIVEGPMSVVYGTDAIGGVINIITKQSMRMSSRSRIKLFADQIGNLNLDGSLSEYRTLKKGSAWGFDATMGRQFFRGFDFDPETRSMDWKPKTRVYGDGSIFYQRKNWKQSLRYAQYHEYLLDRSNAEFNLINITGYNSYFYTQRRDISAVTDVKLNDQHSLRFQNAYNRYDREKRNVRRNLVTGSEVLTRPEDQDTTLNTAFNLRGLWEYQSKKSRFNTLLGYEIQQEQISTLRIKQMQPILDAALFGSLEYNPIPQLNIKPSLRLAYNSVFGQNPLPGFLGEGFKIAPLIPSLQIKSALSEHLVLRGSYARGFRAPTAKELYFLFVDINHNVQGNKSLQSEQSHNFNLSIDYRHSIAKDIAATFKLASFHNAVKNEIQLSLVDLGTNLYQYINIGMLNSAGISSQMQLFLGNWDLTLGFSYITNESQIDAQSGMRKWRVPQSTLNISHEWKKSGTALQWFSRYTGKTLGFMSTGTVYEIAPYGLADINLTQKIYKNRVLLQLGVKNLFNVSQIQNTAPNSGVHATATGGINIAMGRNLFLQCTVNL
jgi:outer membrane receptor for ferrienterochelin and colicins